MQQPTLKQLRELDEESVAAMWKVLIQLSPSDPVANGDLVSGGDKSAALSRDARVQGNAQLLHSPQDALVSYTRSIALAPCDSEELALGFANRAAALISLRRHEAALRDVDRALAAGYPKHLHHKLEERRERCLKALGGTASTVTSLRNTRKSLPLVAGAVTPSATVSMAVAIVIGANKQRSLQAVGKLSPGDILVVEKALATVIFKRKSTSLCCHCAKHCLSMIPCKQCSQAMFCSESCRDQAWTSYHSVKCHLLAIVSQQKEVKDAVRLPLRLLLTLCAVHGGLRLLRNAVLELESEPRQNEESRILDKNGLYDPLGLRAVHFLSRRSNLCPHSEAGKIVVLSAAWAIYILNKFTDFFAEDADDALKKFFGGLLLRYVKIHRNCSLLMAEYNGVSEDSTGYGLCPTICLANNSCNPNAYIHWAHGDTAILTAAKPIAKGDEIFVAYYGAYSTKPKSERKEVHQQYNFECKCIACIENWPVSDVRHSTFKMSTFTFKCRSCGKHFRSTIHKTAVTCEQCCEVNSPMGVFRTIIHSKPHTLQEAGSIVKMCHQSMVYPNDLFVEAVLKMMRLENASGNCTDDSW